MKILLGAHSNNVLPFISTLVFLIPCHSLFLITYLLIDTYVHIQPHAPLCFFYCLALWSTARKKSLSYHLVREPFGVIRKQSVARSFWFVARYQSSSLFF